MNYLCTCKNYTYLVAINYLLFLLRWPNCFVQYSRHVLRHLHWNMPSPHCTPCIWNPMKVFGKRDGEREGGREEEGGKEEEGRRLRSRQ